jgi:hypothetical protein
MRPRTHPAHCVREKQGHFSLIRQICSEFVRGWRVYTAACIGAMRHEAR